MEKICLNNWGDYNEGKAGEWFYWPLSNEEKKRIESMEGPFIVTFEDEYLDTYFFDCEKISVSKFLEVCENYEKLYDYEKRVFAADVEVNGMYAIDRFYENPEYVGDLHLADVSDDYELGVYCIEELGILDIPEYLQPYFDYEKYGRDVAFDGTYTRQGFLFDR